MKEGERVSTVCRTVIVDPSKNLTLAQECENLPALTVTGTKTDTVSNNSLTWIVLMFPCVNQEER